MRRIISRSRAIATGKYPSLKLSRWTHWESHVERDGHRLVDVAAHVRTFCEQPVAIRYGDGANVLEHVPDLLVRLDTPKPWLVEFKTDEDEELPFARARARLLHQPLAQRGFHYFLTVWSSLKLGAYLANARWLRRYGRHRIDLVQRERVRTLMRRFGALTLRQVGEAFDTPRQGWRAAAALVLEGDLRLEMSKPIDENTVLVWASTDSGAGTWLSAAFGETR
jgi:hypothetical protein